MVRLKRSIKLVIFLFVIGISYSIFVGCFSEHCLIEDFIFYGAVLINPNETIDEKKAFIRITGNTLRNKLFFEIVALGGEHYSANLKNISLISNCYATSVNMILDNDILLEELELKLDSDIYFESEVIEKGTDLWNHPQLKDYKWFYKKNWSSGVFHAYIGFTDSFYDKVQIPQKEYSIEMTCKTSDNKIISKSIKLYLML